MTVHPIAQRTYNGPVFTTQKLQSAIEWFKNPN